MLRHDGLEYETCGEGEAVLLIHGSHVAESFLPLMKEPSLADRYRLIRYHRRGFAGSGPLPAAFAIEDQARDARSILEHLGVERAHVVGHSYGGVTGLQLALDAPHLVRSLVLLEPALLTVPSGPGMMESLAPALERYETGDSAGAVDAFMRVACNEDWRSTTEAAIPGGPAQADRDAATFFEVEMPALDKWTFDVDRADRISQPVLYVLGGESAPVFQEGVPLLRSWLPQARDLSIPGVDHMLQVLDPRAVADGIARFLGSHAR